jgi:ABC-type multidrug transport system fused ATPase/permease subunit
VRIAQKNWSFAQVKRTLSLFENKDKKKLVLLGITQFSISLLDLIALLLVGLVSTLSLNTISVNSGSKYADFITSLEFFHGYNTRSIILILGGISAILLISKTIVSAILTKKIIGFLSVREAEISSRFVDHYLRLSPRDQQKLSPQYVAGVALSGANSCVTVTLGQLVTAFVEIFSISLLFLGVAFVNPVVTISTILYFSFLAILSMKYLSSRIRTVGKKSFDLGIASSEFIKDLVGTAREVYIQNAQHNLSEVYRLQRLENYRATRSKAFIGLIPKFVFEVGLVLGAILISGTQILFYDAQKAITGMVVFLALTTRLVPSLLKIQNALLELRAASAPTENFLDEFERISRVYLSETMNEKKPKFSKLTNDLPEKFVGEISAVNLCVQYADSERPVLENLDLYINPGEFVAIVGPSGSGKTSLVDALLGIMSPKEGTVSISGLPPRMAIAKWPGKMKYVPQDVQLISGTLKSNICWPLPPNHFSDSSIIDVLEIVQLTNWLDSQPLGLETLVGLGGLSMSGGQKQRLGIARALLVKPDILILDESTSSLDTETELLITSRILNNMKSLTRIVIAHRLSTVINADKIVYIENGRKKAEGNFGTLRQEVPEFDNNAKLNGIL